MLQPGFSLLTRACHWSWKAFFSANAFLISLGAFPCLFNSASCARTLALRLLIVARQTRTISRSIARRTRSTSCFPQIVGTVIGIQVPTFGSSQNKLRPVCSRPTRTPSSASMSACRLSTPKAFCTLDLPTPSIEKAHSQSLCFERGSGRGNPIETTTFRPTMPCSASIRRAITRPISERLLLFLTCLRRGFIL